MFRLNDNLNSGNIRSFVWKRRNFALQKPFRLLLNTEGNWWHINIRDSKMGKILGRMDAILSKPKAESFWQLEKK